MVVPPAVGRGGEDMCPVGWEHVKSPPDVGRSMGGLDEIGLSAAPNLAVVLSEPHLPEDGHTICQLPSWKPAAFLMLESSL